jgi:hypothetical protein
MNKKLLEILRLYLKSESINDSLTSVKANGIVNEYSVSIQAIMKNIFSENEAIEISRMKYGKRITRLYQELEQKTYLLSLDFLEKSSGIYPLINSIDIEVIKKRSLDNAERFWSLLSKRELQVKTEAFTLASILNYIAVGLSAIVFSSLQSHTVNRNKIRDSNLNFSDDSPERTNPFKMMWLTEDDSKVCPICFPLHGRVFEGHDEIPRIPQDTHPNCRCRVVPVDDNGNPISG